MSVLVGKKAPKFSATAVVNGSSVVRNFSIEQFIGKNMSYYFFTQKIFLEFVPLNFTTSKKDLKNLKKKMSK